VILSWWVAGGVLPRVDVRLACACDGSSEVARVGAGSTIRWVFGAFHLLPWVVIGRVGGGHSPPTVSIASPIKASADLNPNAIRVSRRILVLIESTSPLDRPSVSAAPIRRRHAGQRPRLRRPSRPLARATPTPSSGRPAGRPLPGLIRASLGPGQWRQSTQGACAGGKAVAVARIDYFNDPNAPKANSIVPSVTAVVPNERGELLLVHKTA
jgi:hypothetical protein